jgi:LmbE family N-acetylglucosaminyl deacetylase
MPFWETHQKILVVLAHPDDPEFFCGGTLSIWAKEGHEINYCLLTMGDKGINEQFKGSENIKQLRIDEQQNAAKVIGANQIIFLDNEDGYLTPNLELRKDVARVIRKVRPDIVVTCDPTNYYIRDSYINHPDHRAAGQVVIDAVFPAAQNELFFPDLVENEKLLPHHVKEVWISLPKEPNVFIDITGTWENKINALMKHASQIGETDKFLERMRTRRTEDSTDENPRYEELFRRVVFN